MTDRGDLRVALLILSVFICIALAGYVAGQADTQSHSLFITGAIAMVLGVGLTAAAYAADIIRQKSHI